MSMFKRRAGYAKKKQQKKTKQLPKNLLSKGEWGTEHTRAKAVRKANFVFFLSAPTSNKHKKEEKRGLEMLKLSNEIS